MNLPSRFSRRPAAFTLIELLTVIAIIAVLAAMLLPVISTAVTHARITRAKNEEATLVNAIEAYESAYGRFPVSVNAQSIASANGSDFTYGGFFKNSANLSVQLGALTNAEVVAILMDMTAYPNGVATVDANHVKNPKSTIFLNAQLSSYNPSSSGQGLPGVDITGVYRDPWGNPYIITMDLNYDNQCSDAFYSSQTVSQNPPLPASYSQTGFNGLFNPNVGASTPAQLNDFLFRGKVMVWSAGPDGKIDNSLPGNSGVNQDNVLSWK